MPYATERIALLIFPNFSLLGYAMVVEMLRFANENAGRDIYQSIVVAERGQVIECSNGTQIVPDATLGDVGDIDKILVCSSIRSHDNPGTTNIYRWLKACHRRGTPVGALGSGVWMLAEAGLLDHRQCAVHWREVDAFRESYPRASLSSEHYIIDGSVFTCVGGDSVTDMMLEMIASQHGELFAEQLRGTILLKPAQIGSEQQNLLSRALNGKSASRLQYVLKLMQDHIEQPLSLPRLCELIGINTRTLVRDTQEGFGCSPKVLYSRVRFERARSLLAHSSKDITHIAISCGFRSLAHFSSAFKQHVGTSPSQWRAMSKH